MQGRLNAPPLVKLCLDRWESLNPSYDLRVLDQPAVEKIIGKDVPFWADMKTEALSDIVRARLLLDEGGIWTDATVLPLVSLEKWLPPLTAESSFFAYSRPGADRPISSWLIASGQGHVIIQKWWDEILQFWDKPRTLNTYGGGLIAPDPIASVSPAQGGATDEYPYFWFHYLFDYILSKDPEAAAIWDRCAKIPARGAHALHDLLEGKRPTTRKEMIRAANWAPVQKMSWRSDYPISVLSALPVDGQRQGPGWLRKLLKRY
jgi:hypothetical protein